MIEFEKHTLENGLIVLLHEDHSTPMVSVNVMYDVGSRDENPDKTGLAHLFEHLMFSGSINVPDFDIPIQNAGGENNAFTSADLTTFYNLLPAQNMEIGFWLESDRMLQLAFSEQMLNVQKKVVVEEFKETCLNVPYGNLWHELADLCYQKHPYKWPTIGKDFSHIEGVKLGEIEEFFNVHYKPNNAVLSVTGNFETKDTLELIKKWFSPIPRGMKKERKLNFESPQLAPRKRTITSNVPKPSISLAFPMVSRLHEDYYVYDLISDLYSTGKSSRLHNQLVKKEDLFTSVGAFISGSFDPGLFVMEGKVNEKKSLEDVKSGMWKMLNQLKEELVGRQELEKIKNKIVSQIEYSEISIINKGINLCTHELLGDANDINNQAECYLSIQAEDIQRVANQCFLEQNCNELWILPVEQKITNYENN